MIGFMQAHRQWPDRQLAYKVSRPITMALNTSIRMVSGGMCDDNAKEKQFLNAMNDESRVAGDAKPDRQHLLRPALMDLYFHYCHRQ